MQAAVETAKVLIGGEWRESDAEGVFEPENPSTGEKLGREFPVMPDGATAIARSRRPSRRHTNWKRCPPRRLPLSWKDMRPSWTPMPMPLPRLRMKKRRFPYRRD
jgi:hypothetical protein